MNTECFLYGNGKLLSSAIWFAQSQIVTMNKRTFTVYLSSGDIWFYIIV